MWPTTLPTVRLSISLTGIVLMCISAKGLDDLSHSIGDSAEEIPVCITRIKLIAAHLFKYTSRARKGWSGLVYYRHYRLGGSTACSAGCSLTRLISTCPARFCESESTF